MFIFRRLSRLGRTLQFALVAAAAFAIGSATIAAAATAGIPVGSLFYIPMINGTATTPCSSANGPAGQTTTCNAIVDSAGNLHVSGALSVNNFPPAPADQAIHGSVSITNPTADQMIHGMVGINNYPDTQKVSGHVNVDNLPATQAVSGTVSIGNLPATQTVHVDNVPATQNVNIVGGGSSGGTAVVTKSLTVSGNLDHLYNDNTRITLPVNMKVTMIDIAGCSQWVFALSGGGGYSQTNPGIFTFPYPMDFTTVFIQNTGTVSGCDYLGHIYGY